jgi:hypothetical protein
LPTHLPTQELLSCPSTARRRHGFADVDTAALVIDLDAFERNLRRMADFVGKASARLRAHAKTHKSPIIAARQMEPGAVGVCCQKASAAEVRVEGGIGGARVANRLSPHSRGIVCIATSFAPSLRRRLGDGKRAIFKTACASPGALT